MLHDCRGTGRRHQRQQPGRARHHLYRSPARRGSPSRSRGMISMTDIFKKHVLVVDDEANMRHMLANLLGKEGYTVDTAADGEEALAKVEAVQYQFVLCDLKMPKMDGMAFLEKAKSIIFDTTIIMMSAYGT